MYKTIYTHRVAAALAASPGFAGFCASRSVQQPPPAAVSETVLGPTAADQIAESIRAPLVHRTHAGE